MKKYLVVVMAVVVSAFMFAGERGNGNCQFQERGNMMGRMMDRGGMPGKERMGHMLFKVAAKEDFIKAGVTEENYTKADNTIKTAEIQLEKNRIAIEQKHLEIEKLTLEDNKNWTEIEKLLNDAAKLKADTELKQMKLRDEVKKYVTEDQFKSVAKSLRDKMPMMQKGNEDRNDFRGNGKEGKPGRR